MARAKKTAADGVCRTWGEFLDAIKSARESLEFGPSEECFYRGLGDASWPLLPSLMRVDKKRRRQVELSLFYEFRARARELHTGALTAGTCSSACGTTAWPRACSTRPRCSAWRCISQ